MIDEFITGIFTVDYFSFLPVVGSLVVVVVVGFVVNIIAVGSHDAKDLPPIRDKIGVISLCFWVPALLLAIVLLVADWVVYSNEKGDREILLTNELVIGGYNSAFDVELDSVNSADDATFKYVDDNKIVSCELVGTSNITKYKVVCFD